MNFSQRIAMLLVENNRNQAELSRFVGVKANTVSDWIHKGTSPKIEHLYRIADFFSVSFNYLFTGQEKNSSTLKLGTDEQELLDNYKKLSELDKGKVIERARILAETNSEEKAKPITMNVNATYIDLYDMPVSTGMGTDLSGYDKEKIKIKQSDEAEQADFCLRISGDSMEPDFHDGDIVLVKGCPTINIGAVGIFVVNGSGYIKELGRNKLISLNDEYDDIKLTENDSVWCMGEVIGTLENDDFLD